MWNGAQRLDVGAAAHARGLDHLAAGAARRLGAERRPLVAVQLEHRQPDRVGGARDLVERRVDEHADDLDPALQRRRDLGAAATLAAPRASAARRSARSPTRRRRAASWASSSGVMPQNLILGAWPRTHRTDRRASMSGRRISASPISTASTPASAELLELLAARLKPDSATTVDARRDAAAARRSRGVDLQRRQVTVVDADQIGARWRAPTSSSRRRGPRPARPGRARGPRVQLRQLAGVERRDDQQDRVGPRRERLVDLVRLDDEVLAQDRQPRDAARAPQVVERAAEAGRLGEDRERGGAAALVGADHVLELEVLADHAGRGRAALVLGDQRESGPRAARRRKCSPGRRSLRRASARRRRRARVELAHGCVHGASSWVRATKRSSASPRRRVDRRLRRRAPRPAASRRRRRRRSRRRR